jgi:hypothetical protein
VACDPASLVAESDCINCSLSHKQILAALLYAAATAASMSTNPSTLVAESACIRCAMTEKQILAALLYVTCAGGGSGGGGSAAPDSISYAGPPIVNPPALAYVVVDSNYVQWQYGPNGWQ